MARKRWATFSVADHLDLRSLVPDVLLFDRLVFPYPEDAKQEIHWAGKGWNPEKLNYCLLALEELAYPVAWGKTQEKEFSSNMEQAANLEHLLLSPIDLQKLRDAPETAKKEWEAAKAMTREMLKWRIEKECGANYLAMPRYGSEKTFLDEQKVTIGPANRNSRREALALLVSQKMAVPWNADEKVALRLAIDLARDGGYRQCRNALYDWQESVLQQDQTTKEDAEALDHLISTLNSYISVKETERHNQWIVFVLKRLAGIPELAHPLGALKVAIDVGEFISRGGYEMAPGAMAAFHHVRQRVIEPSARHR